MGWIWVLLVSPCRWWRPQVAEGAGRASEPRAHTCRGPSGTPGSMAALRWALQQAGHTVRGLASERTVVQANCASILVWTHILPWPVNVMIFPLQSQGLAELGEVLLSCSRKAIETCSQAQQVVHWCYPLQHSLGIMKEMKKRRSIYGGTRTTLILFLFALSPVSF